jgi:hypothetical protein
MRQKTIWRKPAVFFLAAALWVPLPGLYAQTGAGTTPADGQTGGTGAKAALPRQFRELSLGMGLDDLKSALQKDGLFSFRGDRDVSLLPAREQSLVETTGRSFIRRAFFQLRDGQVFIMAFTLNTAVIDHYSMFTHFVQKYGEPAYLDPKETVWETEDTRVALERPLTVKYIDKTVFNDIITESGIVESRQVQEREDFLDEF